jgi:hypothetical protein
LLYIGENRRVVGMGGKYSCKQVQNLQPIEDIISTAEDIQYDGKITVKSRKLVSRVSGRLQAEGVREYCAEEDIGLEREEARGVWRKVRSEELHDLHSSPNTGQILEDCLPLPSYREKTPR